MIHNLMNFQGTMEVNSALLAEALGQESLAAYTSTIANHSKLETSVGAFSNQTMAGIEGLIKNWSVNRCTSDILDDETQKRVTKYEDTNIIESVANDFVKNGRKRAMLPLEVQKLVNPIGRMQTKLTEKAAATAGTSATEAKQYEFKKAQVDNAMFKTLFNVFSSSKAATESISTYQSTIVYHKLEAMIQYLSTCTAIYNKIVKSKTLLDETTAFPIHTWITKIEVIDDEGKVVGTIRREDLWNVMDPKNAKDKIVPAEGKSADDVIALLYNKLERRLELTKAQCNGKIYGLRTDNLVSGKPFLGTNEVVRSDFYVYVKLANVNDPIKLYDIKSGLVKSETFAEVDYKGKYIPFVDPSDKKQGVISLTFDGNDQLVGVILNDDALTNKVEKVIFEFKLYDLFQQAHGHIRFRQNTERTFINAGTAEVISAPLIKSEMAKIDARTGGDHYARYMALTAEYINNSKDNTFFKDFASMKADLINAFKANDDTALYAEQSVDLQIMDSLLKREDMQFHLGPAIQNIQTQFEITAKTQNRVQMNMWTSSYSLNVINPMLSFITGVVNEDNNGTFMGVSQGSRAAVMTIGADTNNPIAAIVVGSDKKDLTPNYYKNPSNPSQGILDAKDVVHHFNIIPYFAEANTETGLFVDTPTRVLSDPGFRDPTTPYVPTVRTTWTAKYMPVRAAGGDFRIKGFHMIPMTTRS